MVNILFYRRESWFRGSRLPLAVEVLRTQPHEWITIDSIQEHIGTRVFLRISNRRRGNSSMEPFSRRIPSASRPIDDVVLAQFPEVSRRYRRPLKRNSKRHSAQRDMRRSLIAGYGGLDQFPSDIASVILARRILARKLRNCPCGLLSRPRLRIVI